MAKKNKKSSPLRFIVGLISFLIIVSILGIYLITSRNLVVDYAPGKLARSNESLSNPYCGWYHTYFYKLTEESFFDSNSVKETAKNDNGTSLCLLDININAYANQDISTHALSELDAILSAWSSTEKEIILNINYGDSSKNSLAEPLDVSNVYLHMEQLTPVIKEHANHIYMIQGAFIGDNGLYQNSMYNSENNIVDLTNYLGSLISFNIYQSTTDSAMYMKANQLEGMPSALSADNPISNQNQNNLAFRLGISQNNISATNSQANLDNISSISTWAPVGGSVTNDPALYDLATAISTLKNMHVSYLNADSDAAVLNQWKSLSYQEQDAFEGVTGYDYITSHLGYRYVINSTSLDFNSLLDETGKLSIEVENIGFANSLKNFDVSLVLKNTDTEELIKIPINTDTTTWYPNEKITLNADLQLRDYTKGNFNVFLLVIDSTTGSIIKLGTSAPISTNGYQIATMKCGVKPE